MNQLRFRLGLVDMRITGRMQDNAGLMPLDQILYGVRFCQIKLWQIQSDDLPAGSLQRRHQLGTQLSCRSGNK
jgi:hypothetical protein